MRKKYYYYHYDINNNENHDNHHHHGHNSNGNNENNYKKIFIVAHKVEITFLSSFHKMILKMYSWEIF